MDKSKEKILKMKLEEVEGEITKLIKICAETMAEELDCRAMVSVLDNRAYSITFVSHKFAFIFVLNIGKNMNVEGVLDGFYSTCCACYMDVANDYIASYLDNDVETVELLTQHLSAETVAKIVSEL